MDKATGQNTPANRPNVRVVVCCCCPFELAASFLLKLRVSAQIGLLLESEWVMRGERSSSAVESILWSCDNSPLIEYEWDITVWPWLYHITPCLLHLLWSQISCFFGCSQSNSRDAEIIWFVLNAELDAQTVIFRRRKSLIQNLWTDCWYWCDSRVHDGNIEFHDPFNTVTCIPVTGYRSSVYDHDPPPFVLETRNNMVPKATHIFMHW